MTNTIFVACGRPYKRDKEVLDFFDGISERTIEDIEPKTVLDSGCARGFWWKHYASVVLRPMVLISRSLQSAKCIISSARLVKLAILIISNWYGIF